MPAENVTLTAALATTYGIVKGTAPGAENLTVKDDQHVDITSNAYMPAGAYVYVQNDNGLATPESYTCGAYIGNEVAPEGFINWSSSYNMWTFTMPADKVKVNIVQ